MGIIAGQNGLGHKIRANRVQKPGLRMIEPYIQLEEGKIQILGRTEVSYFNKLSPHEQEKIAEILSSQDVPCFIISKGLAPPILQEVVIVIRHALVAREWRDGLIVVP